MNSILNLFKKCSKINYCIWKSTDQIHSSLSGKTDFDILVSYEHKDSFNKILRDFGFFFTVKSKTKQYLENEYDAFFLNDNLNLIHFHIYTSIIIGTKKNKNYKLVFEKDIFQFNFKDISLDIKIINPEIELFLLLCRYYLKLKNDRSNSKLLKELNNQYVYLKNKLLNVKSNSLIPSFKLEQDNLDFQIIQKFIHENKIFKNNFFKKIEKKKNFFLFSLKKRTFGNKGLTVAIVGADGSGKTTLVNNIFNIFNKKISTKKIYLGKIKIFKNKYLSSVINIINKFLRLIIISYYDKLGYLILIDRYPQSRKNFNDGPILSNDYLLSSIEKKIYLYIEKIFYTKLLFKVICDTEKTLNRKKNLKIEVLDKKNSHIIDHNYNSKRIEILNGMNSLQVNTKDIINTIIENNENY